MDVLQPCCAQPDPPSNPGFRCRWRRDPHQAISLAQGSWKELQSEFVSLFKQRLFSTLHDFDDHLDDVSKDPMNPHLTSRGKMALPGQLM